MEVLVATGLASIVFVGIAALTFYSGRSFAAMANYVDLDHRSRIALDTMTKQIRQANRLISHTAAALVFEDHDGGTLSFVYDPEAKTLRRVKNGVSDSDPLLEGCDSIQFSIYQRNPIGGTYNQHPTATVENCKLVQLNWICSRKILGTTKNTESVQSAKIVIRKQ